MPRSVADVVCAVTIAGLILLARSRPDGESQGPKAPGSFALWLPALWLWFTMTRPLSVWLGMAPPDTAEQLLDGSPIDRGLFLGLMVAASLVLLLRGRKLVPVLVANLPIALFFLYCGASVTWSDYPAVAMKRWVKSLGDVVMILVILSDRNPSLAVEWLITRLAFLIMPLSILFIKYYPELGRAYSRWEGKVLYTGVTTNKNLLGMACLVLGVALLAYLLQLLWHKDWKRHLGPLFAYGATIVLLFWVLWLTQSMTSIATLALICGLVLATTFMSWLRRPAFLSLLVVTLLIAAVYALIVNPGAGLVASLGRDTTLTGRTDLWQQLLTMTANPMLGAGFESFWLGSRLRTLWTMFWWQPNEAHNGYLEIFLNLGWIGIFLLVFVLATGFRKVLPLIARNQCEGSLRLGFLVAALVYNLSEAAFKLQHPLWFFFLWAIMASPMRAPRHSRGSQTPYATRRTSASLEPGLQPSGGRLRSMGPRRFPSVMSE